MTTKNEGENYMYANLLHFLHVKIDGASDDVLKKMNEDIISDTKDLMLPGDIEKIILKISDVSGLSYEDSEEYGNTLLDVFKNDLNKNLKFNLFDLNTKYSKIAVNNASIALKLTNGLPVVPLSTLSLVNKLNNNLKTNLPSVESFYNRLGLNNTVFQLTNKINNISKSNLLADTIKYDRILKDSLKTYGNDTDTLTISLRISDIENSIVIKNPNVSDEQLAEIYGNIILNMIDLYKELTDDMYSYGEEE